MITGRAKKIVGSQRAMSGYTYVEVLVAAGIMMIALVPAIDALRTSATVTSVYTSRVANHYRLAALFESTLAESFDALDSAATAAGSNSTPSSFSDAPGLPNRRVVFLSQYDGDNADADNDPFTGVDANLIWVRVEYENTNDGFSSLTSR